MDAEQRALLPCPFCGGSPRIELRDGSDSNGCDFLTAVLDCGECPAQMEKGVGWYHSAFRKPPSDKEEAARQYLTEAWNTRALTQAQPGWRVVPVEFLAETEKVLARIRRHLQAINDDCDGDNHLNESCDALDVLGAYENNTAAMLAAAPAPQQGEHVIKHYPDGASVGLHPAHPQEGGDGK